MVLMNLFAGQQWRNRHKEQTYRQGEGEEREDKMYGESNMEIYNTLFKRDSQWEFTIRLRELKALWQEGWDRERNGKEVQEGGDICVPMADSSCMTENHKIL